MQRVGRARTVRTSDYTLTNLADRADTPAKVPVSSPVTTKTIVVADDTAFVRDRFRSAIESAGHRALTAASGRELLELLRGDARADLVVLDLHLPQARGVELVRTLMALEHRPAIVVFSGTIATPDEVRELAALGVTGFINEYVAPPHIIPALAPHLFPDNANRRASPRVILAINITYRVGNAVASGLTLNVSSGGLAIKMARPLAIGTPLRVRFRLPGVATELEPEGRVAWSEPGVGMGLQFTRIDADAQKALDTFVQARFFSNRKA